MPLSVGKSRLKYLHQNTIHQDRWAVNLEVDKSNPAIAASCARMETICMRLDGAVMHAEDETIDCVGTSHP